MTEYDFSYGEDSTGAEATYRVVRVKDINHVPQEEATYDVWNIGLDGSFVLRHIGDPVFGQDKSNSTNSGTSVVTTLDTAPQAGSLLLVAAVVDETPGTRTFTTPSGFVTFGGNTISTAMRVNLWEKISDGTETAVTVTISGTSELAVIYTEIPNFNFYRFSDIADTEFGTGTTAGASIVAPPAAMVNLFFSFTASRPATHSSPTNGYTQQEQVTTTNMRLSSYTKFVGDGSDPDISLTLGSSVNWITRLGLLSPERTLIETTNGSEYVYLNAALLPFQEDVLPNPGANRVGLYVREDPDSANDMQPVFIHQSSVIHEIPFARQDGPRFFEGAGSPEGVVTAIVGSMYMRTDGGASTTLYVKTSGTGNTGWTAK